MRSLYHAAILSLPFFGVVLAQNAPSPTNEDDKQGFQDLLNALPEESLHAALHGHIPTFQDGIFESSRHGVKRVHDKNPGLATRLIVAAVQDLRKRQAPETNGTTSADTPSSQTPTQLPPSTPASTPTSIPASSPAQSSAPPASNTPVATPSESRTQNPPPSSSTPVDSSSEDEKPTPTPEPTPETTVEVPVTITSEGKTITSAQTVPAVIRTTTDSAGKSITTTSAVTETPAPTTKEVRTTTNSKGSTFVTTVTPGGGKVSSIVFFTTTGSDGRPSTRTSYTFVSPTQATGADGKPSRTTAKPSLQTGAAGAKAASFGWVVAGGLVALWV